MRRSMSDEEYARWKAALPTCGKPVTLHDAEARPYNRPCTLTPDHTGVCAVQWGDIDG